MLKGHLISIFIKYPTSVEREQYSNSYDVFYECPNTLSDLRARCVTGKETDQTDFYCSISRLPTPANIETFNVPNGFTFPRKFLIQYGEGFTIKKVSMAVSAGKVYFVR